MSQTRNRNHGEAGSKSRSKSKSKSRSRSRSLSSTSSGRAAHAPKWDRESGYRLHISPLNPRTSRRDIEKIFAKFGTINEVWMATNPPCFAFVNFKHRADAEDAMEALDGKMIDNSRVGISFARKRTIGGRRGGSYNNGGDRHSRGGGYDSSRYRRYSPRQGGDRRRRYSRSRSPVQTNKRDYRQRSRSKSSSPKTRRNRPSSRERSPQQQAVNVVHRYSDNDDRSE